MRINSTQFPCFETPARCYLTCQWNNTHLSSDQTCCVWMAEERDKWCEWYLLPIGNTETFCIQSIKTNCFLSISEEDGKIVARKNMIDSWFLEQRPSSHGGYLIIHEKNGEPLGGGPSSQNIIPLKNDTKDETSEKMKNVWSLEIISGELCFLSSPGSKELCVGCDLGGRIYTTKNFGGWEVWRFTEAGDGFLRISSWTHHSRILCSDRTGQVYTEKTTSTVLPGGKDKWKVQKAPLGFHGVTIQSPSTGQFLQLFDGTLRTVESVDGSSCIWHLTAANRNKYYLLSLFLKKRISTSKTEPFMKRPLSKDISWTLKWIDDESFSIYAESHDRYLGSNGKGIVTVSQSMQDYEKWLLQETDDGYYYIVSKKHARYLTCEKNGKLMTIDAIDKIENLSHKWYLEISMPFALSGKQVVTTTIAGATVAGIAVMAPLASGAICTASIAASGISLEAASAGALIGGSLFGVTCALSKEKGSTGQLNIDGDTVLDDFQMNRPLCTWGDW